MLKARCLWGDPCRDPVPREVRAERIRGHSRKWTFHSVWPAGSSSCQLAGERGGETGSSAARHLPSPHVTGAIGIFTSKPLAAPKWKC